MPYPDLTDCTASELADLIRGKQLSPVEVTTHFLERISRYNDELRAFITTAPEHAMAEAHRAEAAVIAGDALGPFHGVPIGIKDLSDTKGIRTTYGSLLFGENVPTHDNIAVERIRASGAIIAGKTNTPDFGWKGTTESTIIGACANPWDTSRTSGGSSGGAAAALAARAPPAVRRQRRGRLDPHPVQLLRNLWHQTDHGPRPRRLHASRLGDALSERPSRYQRSRRRHDAERACRT